MSNISIETELKKSYLEYSLSVIIGRAIPDVRDGLKPVHRRILYAMHELSNTYNRAYKKSARVVGDVIGKYHPHGDSSVYDALVRMAQGFNMRDILVDGQGNFGSIDGDSAAAMRYTEVRMTKLGGLFLDDIEKDTVNFRMNYDNSLKEPVVLPTRVPNLLVNGSSGIAVGMATSIPPHNLGDIVDSALLLLANPDVDIDELIAIVKAPDFPTAGFVYGMQGVRDAYRTGRGNVKMRGRLHVEERSKGMESIVVTEIPYALNKSALVEKIAALVNEDKIEGVTDLRDESDRKGIRIVLDIKRGVYSDLVINQLYKHTSLQTSMGIIFLAVVNSQPKVLNLKQMLGHFLEYRKDVITRRSKYDLEKALHRSHILEGLHIALDNIDEVVSIIRGSKTALDAKERLEVRFKLSSIQSQAILEMRLQRLVNMEREKLLEEHRELLKLIEYLTGIIENQVILRGVVQEELENLKKDFSSPRKSEIMAFDPDSIDIEDIIPDEEVVITLSKNGYIKRTALNSYQTQKRGGKGIAGVSLQDKDLITSILTTSNHQFLYLFTSKGRMYQIKVHQIPEGSRTARGIHVANLFPLDTGEYIVTALSSRPKEQDEYYMFFTKKGIVKRSAIDLYKNVRSVGLIAVSLREEDELVGVIEVNKDDEFLLVTKKGQSIRFSCEEVRSTGRNTSGVKGIALRAKDSVIAGVVVRQDGRKELLTVAEKGYGKRTHIDHFRAQSRGGMGVINMRVTEKTGEVIGAMMASDADDLLILSSGHKIVRIRVNEINVVGRATQGVRLVRLSDTQTVVNMDLIDPSEEIDAENVTPEE